MLSIKQQMVMGFCVGVDDEEGFWKKALYIYKGELGSEEGGIKIEICFFILFS